METALSANGPILLFDGVCNLCVGSVQFVLKRDKQVVFRFASLQSKFGQQALSQAGLGQSELNTMLLMEGDKIYQRSSAALRVAKHLSGWWPFLYYLFIWIPAPLRDVGYGFVAKRRYRWFGKREACMIPTPELKARFLS